MTPVGYSTTPGQLLDKDPVQSAKGVAVVNISTCPTHVQLVTDGGQWLARARC